MGEHAVVVGGSVGGLLAARALAEVCDEVTVLDRDRLPAGDEPRRSVPQGSHAHAFIASGQDAIEELFPGICAELVDDGATTYSPPYDAYFSTAGHKLPHMTLGLNLITATRPFIEGHVRRRVRALGNVKLQAGYEVRSLLASADGRRVTGVQALSEEGSERAIEADLVVAATGRSARVPGWLEEIGFGRPPETELKIDLAYSSRLYRMPYEAMPYKAVLIGPRPGLPQGIGLFAQEHDHWLLTLGGLGDHHPPTDERGFWRALEKVAPAEVVAALAEAEALGEIVRFGFPSERRRHYERMRRFPDGLLLLGDAICSFNPLYGQGMSVAALEALALRRCARDGSRGLRRRYFRSVKGIVDHAWKMATSGDLALPEVAGERPLSVRIGNAYVERVQSAATESPEVGAAFVRVAGMLESPSYLMRPAIARRVLGRRRAEARCWPGEPPQLPIRRSALRLDGLSAPLREAGPRDSEGAVVFIHGVPGSGADFEPLLAAAGRMERAVAWDAPGFGKADKPVGFDHSIDGHARFIGRALQELGIERAHLVLHDFGGPWGLAWAKSAPEQLASVTLLCTGVPVDYRWHRMARIWRMPGAGELSMSTLTRAGFRASLRGSGPHRLPGPLVDRMYEDLDKRTRQAILRLYRSVGDLDEISRDSIAAFRPANKPALVIWGKHDPYLPVALAERQRDAFPEAQVHVLEESGHWPFVDQAERTEELLAGFLEPVLANPDPRRRDDAPVTA